MLSRRKAYALIVVALFLSVIAGIVYFNIVNQRNSKQVNNQSQVSDQTSTLKAQILSLKGQLANLTGIVENLTLANLVTSLETHEMIGANSSYMGGLVPTPVPYNYLWIEGSVTNTGKGYAVNAGLQVVAYAANGTLEVNLTVPFTGTIFGSDNATNAFVSKNYGNSSLVLQILDSGQTTNVGINIFHEGAVDNWTITPVCWSYAPTVLSQNQPLSSQVAYLENQVENLNAMIASLSTANLVASLNMKEYPATTQYGVSFENSLFIVGSVTNTGEGAAYNAGLHIVAYNAEGKLEINMTVPAEGGTFTYDSSTYTNPPKLPTINSGYGFDSYSSSNSASIGMTIYSPEFVSNYTVTPVWTDSP
ncbi:MAG: hypothetical protein ABSF44_13285 [Candidatus Bathyarchaeia archaeon]|jgi:hypothetical protein